MLLRALILIKELREKRISTNNFYQGLLWTPTAASVGTSLYSIVYHKVGKRKRDVLDNLWKISFFIIITIVFYLVFMIVFLLEQLSESQLSSGLSVLQANSMYKMIEDCFKFSRLKELLLAFSSDGNFWMYSWPSTGSMHSLHVVGKEKGNDGLNK